MDVSGKHVAADRRACRKMSQCLASCRSCRSAPQPMLNLPQSNIPCPNSLVPGHLWPCSGARRKDGELAPLRRGLLPARGRRLPAPPLLILTSSTDCQQAAVREGFAPGPGFTSGGAPGSVHQPHWPMAVYRPLPPSLSTPHPSLPSRQRYVARPAAVLSLLRCSAGPLLCWA